MAVPLRVLMVEDSLDDCALILHELRKGGFDPVCKRVETRQEMVRVLESEQWDLVLSDYYMPQFDALQAFSALKSVGLDLPFILVSGSAGDETSVDAMRAGIHDYIFKQDLNRLCPAVERELTEARFRAERRQAREALHRSYAELERRVDERTEELRLANSRLCREVEEHARASEALRLSEARVRSLFSAMSEGFMLVSLVYDHAGRPIDSVLVEVNAAFEQLTHLSTEQLLDKSLKQILPTIEQSWIESFAAVAQSGEAVRFEGYAAPLQKWFQVSAFCPEKDKCAAVLTDITERKRVEEEIKLRNEQLEMAIAALQGGHWDSQFVLAADGSVTYLNAFYDKRLKALVGYADEELPNEPHVMERLIVPEDLPEIDQAFWNHLRGEAPAYDAEFRMRHRNGSIVWTKVRGIARFDAEQNVYSITGVTWDITDRKRIEESVRESEVRFRTMADESPFMIWVHDAEGSLQFVNRAYTEFFGVTAEAVKASGWQPLVHPDDSAAYLGAFAEALRTRKPFHAQARVRRHDGEWRWIDSLGSPRFSPSGEFLGVTGSSPDITEQKLAEEALQQATIRAHLVANTVSKLLQSTEPQGAVQELCETVMQHLDCHVFFNYLAGKHPNRLRLNAYAGIPDEEAQRISWLEKGGTVCGCVAEEGNRIVAEHIPTIQDPRTNLVSKFGITAYACHPLLAPGGKILGTLSFGTRTREIFSAEDLELMKTVTDHVAVAMVRIRAEEELQRANDELEQRVKERTSELTRANKLLTAEIEERARMERSLRETSDLLRSEREALRNKNIAMHEILGHIQAEKESLRRQLTVNIEQAVMPSLQRLKMVRHAEVARLTDLLEHDLLEAVSPFLTTLKQRHLNLTPRELEICRFIRNGMATKEIADTLNVSPMTVQKHRELIRKKLGLNNEEINLQAYLQQMSDLGSDSNTPLPQKSDLEQGNQTNAS